ncbi:MAG: hypothetical protein M1830_000804 [Pleopsidium flavum]|nr:MAG: hypothetical protein M1830_000804 [Pleopsidium flavum]
MATHAIKRRKLGHGSHGAHKVGFSSFDGERTDSDKESTTSQLDTPAKSQISENRTWQSNPRDGSLIAGETYKSSMFKLQIDELLAEIRPNHAQLLASAEGVLRQLKATIEGFPSREPLTVAEAEREMRKSYKIAIPFPDPQPARDVKYTLAYLKPSNISVVGSYAMKTLTSTGEGFAIDLAVTMPPVLFQDKDFLNYRYFYKRAYYIACLAAGLQEARECNLRISYEHQHGNSLLPILVIKPSGDNAEDEETISRCIIRIITAIPEDLFPIWKIRPDKTCIRLNNLKDDVTSTASFRATPFYNATLRVESSVVTYLKLFHRASTLCESYNDVCLLGRVWLRQRGLGKSIAKGGFGPFEWAAICATLLQGGGTHGKPVLASRYSCYQLFKATLQFLATRDMATVPFVMHADDLEIRKSDVPVFFDGLRGMNILYKMTPWSYSILRHEARMTLDMLNDSGLDHFDTTFITRHDEPLQRFDGLVRVTCPSPQTQKQGSLDHISTIGHFSYMLYKILRTALSDRVSLIHLSFGDIGDWAIKSRAPMFEHQGCILVGFLLNPDNAARLVDHGPSAEDQKAAIAFRKFWGEKAELRRFKDGSILESLVWSDEGPKTSTLQQIVFYALQRHLGEEVANSMSFIGDSFGQLLPNNDFNGVQSLAPFRHMLTAFASFEKDLRALEGLPLQLRQVSAVSSELRHSSFHPPPQPLNGKHRSPVDVLAQFESSARWPDDLVAIQRTKFAVLLKIGELLEEAIFGMTTRLGLENGDHTILNASFLEITYPQGAAFRLRVHHDREQALLERRLKNDSFDPRRKSEALIALSSYNRSFLQLPVHTESMRTLCTRFPILSATTRLLKRWCDSHLLTAHVSEELMELLAVRTFVLPYPWQTPSSVMAGFLRTLTFISRWDWRTEPLIVGFSGRLDPKEMDAIKIRFEAWRKIDPRMNRVVLFAASNLDPSGLTWTENGPSKVVTARLIGLARAACTVVKEADLDIDPTTLFISSTADYDFVIHLSALFRGKSRTGQKKQARFKNLQIQSSDDPELIGYNPVQLYLDELKILYREMIVFFHAGDYGDLVAGIWNPQTGPRQWKVNLAYSTLPAVQGKDNDEHRIDVNKTAILNDIARLGGDLIERIVVNR